MRLTLRNLLAYMDGLLDSESANDLKQKIESSKDVTDLVHRIKDTTRRMRLAAPKVEGKSSSLDANSVAEYLDNTLPDEKVVDVEKVCIESDIHLAEVASCHHILTLVLGEPATVNEAARRKMYAVVNNIEALRNAKQPPLLPTDTTTVANSNITPAAKNKPNRGVPDYLREGQKSRLLPWLITAVLAAGITAVALYVSGWFSNDIAVTQNDEKEKKTQPDKDNKQPLKKQQEENQNNTPLPIEPKESNIVKNKSPADDNKTDIDDQDSNKPTSLLTLPKNDGSSDVVPDKGDNLDKKPLIDKPVNKPANPKGISDQKPRTIGRYISESQVLLAYEKNTQQWRRLASGSILQTGTRLVSLPVLRPKIALAGITLQMADGTIVDLNNFDKQTPSLRLINGHIIDMVSVGPQSTKIHVDFGNQRGMLIIKNADTNIALEVRRFRSLGEDPRTDPGPVISTIFVLEGSISWQSDKQTEPMEINKGSALSFVGTNPGTMTASQPPVWAANRKPTNLNQRAANTLLKELKSDRPASISLAERANDRRIEVRYLSSIGQALLGNYTGLVSGLKDTGLKWIWRERYITSLVNGLIRSPEDAKSIYSTFESSFGKQDATILYRMLWGYHPNQLKQGIGDKLVTDYLIHSDVAFRSLSIYNLASIRGATYSYEPSKTASQQSTAVRRWQSELKNGLLVYKTAPPTLSTEAAPAKAGNK